MEQHVEEGKNLLKQILFAPTLPFDESLRSKLPERPGRYAIYVKDAQPGMVLRAGKTAKGGLRERVYQNHLMGDQPGNLRAQLVGSGECADLARAKAWIRQNCVVQFLVVDNDDVWHWAEHFMLSVLLPKYGD